MVQRVNVPGVGTLKFPDGMSQQDMAAAIRQNYPQIHPTQMAGPQPPPVAPPAPQDHSALMASNPGGYDPSSPQFKAKYGNSWVDAVKEGLKGAPSAIKATLLGALQGATFNTGDEMAAGAAMADQRDLPLSQQTINSPEEYQARNQQVLDASRRQLAQSAQEHPYLTAEGNLVGGTALGSNLAKGGLTLAGRATSIPGAIGAGALEGAGYGAAYGAGAGTTPEDRLAQAGKGAAMGAATGAVTGGVAAFAASKGVKLPTTQEIKDKSQAAYQTAENAGVVLTPQASIDLADKVDVALQAANINPRIHGQATAALQALKEDAQKGFTLTKLDQARQLFRDASMTSDAGNNRVAKLGIAAIDSEVKNLQPAQLQAGNAPVALAALKDARSSWSQYSKAQVLDDVMEIADVKGGEYSVSGKENAVRAGFKNLYTSLVRDKAERAMWTDQEVAAIKKVAQGGPVVNFLRFIGKGAVRGPVSGLPALAGYALGGPVGAGAVAAVGEAGKYGALLARLKDANLAQQLIRTGSNAAAPLAMGPGMSAANAGLAALLNQQQMPAGGGVLSLEEQKKLSEKLRNARAAGL
jgi:hypothetical protein